MLTSIENCYKILTTTIACFNSHTLLIAYMTTIISSISQKNDVIWFQYIYFWRIPIATNYVSHITHFYMTLARWHNKIQDVKQHTLIPVILLILKWHKQYTQLQTLCFWYIQICKLNRFWTPHVDFCQIIYKQWLGSTSAHTMTRWYLRWRTTHI